MPKYSAMQEEARTHTSLSIQSYQRKRWHWSQVMWDVHRLLTGPHLERLLIAVRVPMRGSNKEWFALRHSIGEALEGLYNGSDAGRNTNPFAWSTSLQHVAHLQGWTQRIQTANEKSHLERLFIAVRVPVRSCDQGRHAHSRCIGKALE